MSALPINEFALSKRQFTEIGARFRSFEKQLQSLVFERGLRDGLRGDGRFEICVSVKELIYLVLLRAVSKCGVGSKHCAVEKGTVRVFEFVN